MGDVSPQAPETGAARRAAETAARHSYGKLVAFLSRRTHDVAAAQDALSAAFEAALRELDTPFSRKDLPGGGYMGFHHAPDLLRARLLPTAKILPFSAPPTRQ